MAETSAVPAYMRRRGEFDPDPSLATLRERTGIARISTPFGYDAWLVTRHADVRRILSDPQRFSVAIAADRSDPTAHDGMDEQEVTRERGGNLMAHDPPEHTRLRRMLTPVFTMRQVRRLQPWIETIVADQLDKMQRLGPPLDLVQAFALPVPVLVICDLLGAPYEDRADFQHQSSRAVDLSLPPNERTAAFREVRAYMHGLATRARTCPGEGMLSTLHRERGHELTTDELAGIGHLMLVAGYETTATMLALGTLALLRHPDQLRIIRDQPARVDAAVEELLRWLSVVHTATPRVATEPVEIAGQRIEAGEMVLVSLPAANRDPALTPDADLLDVTREATGHLAFGHGVHHCIGAPLARAEMRIAFPALLRRFPNLRLADEQADVQLRTFGILHGITRLPVVW
jgi:cytochrome P450